MHNSHKLFSFLCVSIILSRLVSAKSKSRLKMLFNRNINEQYINEHPQNQNKVRLILRKKLSKFPYACLCVCVCVCVCVCACVYYKTP